MKTPPILEDRKDDPLEKKADLKDPSEDLAKEIGKVMERDELWLALA